MILARGITKSFQPGFLERTLWKKPAKDVLRGFDFEAHPGQITGLLGPNGAGKTTFFRCLTGLERVDRGQLLINGVDPGQHPEQVCSQISLLPEEPGVEPHVSGRYHLELFGTMTGLPLTRVRQRLKEADAHLDLFSFWERPFRTYSRGMKARIALARMRLNDQAQVLIFDEPSNGLDFEITARLHHYIRSMAQEGRTVLISSHVLNDLRVLCDRLVGLHQGVAASPEQIQAWMKAHEAFQATGAA